MAGLIVNFLGRSGGKSSDQFGRFARLINVEYVYFSCKVLEGRRILERAAKGLFFVRAPP